MHYYLGEIHCEGLNQLDRPITLIWYNEHNELPALLKKLLQTEMSSLE